MTRSWRRVANLRQRLDFRPLVIGSGAPLRVLTAQLKTSGFLRLSAGSSATGGAKLGCDGVRRRVRTRRSQEPRDSAAYDRSGVNLRATGATPRFAPFRPEAPGFLRLSGCQCDGWVRTANPEPRPVASEISRAPPPVSVFVKEGPRRHPLDFLAIPCTDGRLVDIKLSFDLDRHVSIESLQRTLTLPPLQASTAKQPAWNRGGLSRHTLRT